MAKIKVKFGGDEVEVDSRDFYVDNRGIGQIIDGIAKSMRKNKARITMVDDGPAQRARTDREPGEAGFGGLGTLEDVEAFESEFGEARPILMSEVREKLKVLESESFFDVPRTVSETAAQMRKYGWAASLLDVSKVLAKMAYSKEILKNSQEHRNYYFAKKALLST